MKSIRLFSLLIAAVLLGQPALGADSLSLAVNYAAFKDTDANTAYVEIYCGLNRHQLTFIGSDTSRYLYAGVFLGATAFTEDSTPVDSASTYFLSQLSDSTQKAVPGISLFDLLLLRLAPGRYRIQVTAIDDVSKNTGHQSLTVNVPDFYAAGLISSDLEPAFEIRDVDSLDAGGANQRLVKEGKLIIPNPTGRYRWGKDSVMSVYSELYGLDTSGGPTGTFAVGYRVKDSLGNDILDVGGARHTKPGGSAVLTKAVDIHTLSPGDYYLLLEAIDLNSRKQALMTKAFSVIGDGPTVSPATSADAQLMVDIAWYFMSEAEKARIKELTTEGKKNFIRQFWRDLDNDPSTPENPVYNDAVRRFAYANESFSTRGGQNDGWKTDRGRVLIMYGFPDKESEEELPGASYPLIKWDYYNIENGVIFIFANDEKAGAADFRLVHSTHDREIHNSDWMERYQNEAPEDDWQGGDDND
ncbi:MAG: GWxTD domain-containing protein [candidate division Zixibacteria bacterium]|nr:GWxTD domain-containing protein [candidate division Zixibacteria bacterium]